MKMYPAKCTDKIQVFESREEYNEGMLTKGGLR